MRRRNIHEALPAGPGVWANLLAKLRNMGRSQWLSWGVALGVVLVVWLSWFVLTLPVRGELHRVQRYLASLPELRDVSVSIPWFARSMPDTVEVSATGLPTGQFQSEVHVELHGTYDTRSRVARFQGVKQVLFPYEKLTLDWERPVPER
jgi:hypothetical protein